MTETLPTVVHVLTSLHFGGIERHMEALAAVSAQSRYRHMFLALGEGGHTAQALGGRGCAVNCLEANPKIPNWPLVLRLARWFRGVSAQVVHTHGAEANFHGLLGAYLARVQVRIGEEVGIPSHSPTARRIFRWVYRRATAVVAVAPGVGHWLVEAREVQPKRLVVLESPVLPRCRERGHSRGSGDALRLAFIGRLERIKNVDALLRGVRLAMDQDMEVELLIIGDGGERARLEALTAELGLAHRVRFLGFQPDPGVYFSEVDVLAQPSSTEGFSLGLVEAMAGMLPVMTTRAGSAVELVSDGVNGFLLDDASPAAIAGAIVRAANLSPEALAAMGVRAFEGVAGRFDPKGYLDRLECLYDGYLAKARLTGEGAH